MRNRVLNMPAPGSPDLLLALRWVPAKLKPILPSLQSALWNLPSNPCLERLIPSHQKKMQRNALRSQDWFPESPNENTSRYRRTHSEWTQRAANESADQPIWVPARFARLAPVQADDHQHHTDQHHVDSSNSAAGSANAQRHQQRHPHTNHTRVAQITIPDLSFVQRALAKFVSMFHPETLDSYLIIGALIILVIIV
ncbi:uncharacterized protein [Dasypus novemcinctus]|uniref:uncharacterized protein isoform X3 n=1 Tax=Dasypus novemcinctus TaxID=9361 RepID=UPI0039C9DE60